MPVARSYCSLKSGSSSIEQIEFDPIIPRIGADLAGIGNFGAGDESFHLVADVADLIVFGIAADIDRLVVDALLAAHS